MTLHRRRVSGQFNPPDCMERFVLMFAELHDVQKEFYTTTMDCTHVKGEYKMLIRLCTFSVKERLYSGACWKTHNP